MLVRVLRCGVLVIRRSRRRSEVLGVHASSSWSSNMFREDVLSEVEIRGKENCELLSDDWMEWYDTSRDELGVAEPALPLTREEVRSIGGEVGEVIRGDTAEEDPVEVPEEDPLLAVKKRFFAVLRSMPVDGLQLKRVHTDWYIDGGHDYIYSNDN